MSAGGIAALGVLALIVGLLLDRIGATGLAVPLCGIGVLVLLFAIVWAAVESGGDGGYE
jgi:hypothetical protein